MTLLTLTRRLTMLACFAIPLSSTHAAESTGTAALSTDSAALTRCCNGDPATYQAFGEKAGIERLMHVFMEGLIADARTRPFFENQNQARIVAQLTDQVCYALEGPCVYSGRAMKQTHQNLVLDRSHFNALVEVLQTAMDQAGIPFRSQNKLLAVFAPMERDIVTR